MARRSGEYGIWDFLSGRSASETAGGLIPRVRLSFPGGSVGINPRMGLDELLLLGLAFGAGYIVCKVTKG